MIAIGSFAVHLAVSGNYGYFRDELYYIAAGHHLGLGYVDFPPMVAVLAALTRVTIGDSLLALHLWPALANALVILLAGRIAAELGGGRFAQGLAALATATSIVFVAIGGIFSMDSLDQLWWVLATFVAIQLIKRGDPRLWLLFGLVAGLGLFTKITIAFFGLAIVVGLLLTPQRVYLRSRWLVLGGFVALAFVAPYIFWNATHQWPTLQFWANYGSKLAPLSFGDFVFQQIYTLNPLTFPLWLAGLGYLFVAKASRPYRFIGWAYVILFVLFAVTHAKNYFLAPAYPALFAAGAVAFEQLVRQRVWRWLGVAYPTVLVVSALLLVPIALPILPPATFARAYGFLGGDAGAQQERHQTSVLPQWFADRFGWENLTATVAGVYNGLPAAEKNQTCVFASNYGEAGAIDFFGGAYGLPHAISGHNTYFIWGPDGCAGQVVITVGIAAEQLAVGFASVTPAATATCDYCMPYEDGVPILIARQPNQSIQALWPTTKSFN
jgi:hypothetical protein